MRNRRNDWKILGILGFAAVCFAIDSFPALAQTGSGSSADATIAKAVGTVKSVQSDSLVVASESSGDVTATVTASTKVLQVPPGEKDLKNAIAIKLSDLQNGDRVLVRGPAGADPHKIAALAVIVMKQSDVSAKQQHEREDWQKRGVGGLVTQVDPTASVVTITTGLGNKTVKVEISKNTILRRYAPNSIRFDDATVAPIDQIKIGDQLRARGDRTADGSQVKAEEVVSGSFRNIAGTVVSVDTAANSLTVQDLIAKGPVVIRLSADSQIKKLPAEMAQRMAARLKSAGNEAGNQGGPPHIASAGNASAKGVPPSGDASARGTGAGAGGPDLQRLLSRLPDSKLGDLQKGDAVMIVSTETGDANSVTAITLLAGVEPLITASGKSVSLLSPWSLSTGGEGDSAP